MIYFEARLSASYPTVEIRVADVCAEAAYVVVVAGLARGLVEAAARRYRDVDPVAPVRHRTAARGHVGRKPARPGAHTWSIR